MLHSRSPTATTCAAGVARRPGPRRGAAARPASRRRRRRRRRRRAASAETRSNAAATLALGVDAPHPLAAAARGRLEEERIAGLAAELARAPPRRGPDRASRARPERPAASMRAPAAGLRAHRLDRRRGEARRRSARRPRRRGRRPRSRRGSRSRDGRASRRVCRGRLEERRDRTGSSRAPAPARAARRSRPPRRAARRGRRRSRPRRSRCRARGRRGRCAPRSRRGWRRGGEAASRLTAECSRASSSAGRRACPRAARTPR